MIDDVSGTFTLIYNFMGECGVSDEVLADSARGGGGRLGFLDRVLRTLNEDDPDRLHVVLQELVFRLDQRGSVGETSQLNSALRENGFEVASDGRIRPTEILDGETEQLGDYLDELLAANQGRLTIETLRYHLAQHRTLYAQGTAPGAAAGAARQFIEQLLTDIASAIALARGEKPNLSRPVLVRNYLRDQEFFSADELKRLVEGIYGYLSEVGAHPGVTDVTAGRMARIVCLNFGVYLLEKFQAFTP